MCLGKELRFLAPVKPSKYGTFLFTRCDGDWFMKTANHGPSLQGDNIFYCETTRVCFLNFHSQCFSLYVHNNFGCFLCDFYL